MTYKHKHAILGGTFDHLHDGHKKFLHVAFHNSEKVTVGLATSRLFQKKVFPGAIQPYEVRLKALTSFLKKNKFYKRANIIKLHDIYGNALIDKKIDALFVTKHGLRNAKKINEARKKIGLAPLDLIVVPYVKASSGEIVSSTDIRLGRMNREGELYKDCFQKNIDLVIPISLRSTLRRPFGKIEINFQIKILNYSFVVAVGDIVTTTLIKNGVIPQISIYDYKTKRARIKDEGVLSLLPGAEVKLVNAAGTISGSTAFMLEKIMRKAILEDKRMGIAIEGEEDLLAIPAILFSPLNAVVVYGLRDKGMVFVEVTEKAKRKVISRFLKHFSAQKS